MSENTDKRTATQRIEDLEKVVTVMYQGVNEALFAIKNLQNLQGEMNIVKEALKLLNKKIEAVVQAAKPETGITVDSVSALVVKMNVLDLQAQVTAYLQNGQITAADTVAANSYLVCEELTTESVVTNPRVQFRLDSQEKATQDAFTGKKVGDTISFGENKLDARILEIYTLAEPKAEAAATAPTEAAPDTAQNAAAPAAEATSAPAQTLEPLPAESPSGFELQFHGTPESSLAPATDPSQATA